VYSVAMRTRPLIAFVLLALVAGCQSAGLSPLQEVVAGRESYTATLTVLNSAHRLGYLSLEQKQQIDPFVKSARAALDSMEAAALAGSDHSIGSDFSRYSAAFKAAFDELLKARLEVEKTKDAVERVRAVPPTAPAQTRGGP
jgi:hypothetical protein